MTKDFKALNKDYEIHSLKLTANAPENRPGPKRNLKKVVVQASIFRGELYVSSDGFERIISV